MYCSKCGAENPEGGLYCQNCGSPLAEYARVENPEPKNNWYGGLSEDEANFIAVKPEYYAQKFSALRCTGNKVSWNWCAFFVFPYWAIYRKMYRESVLYIVGTWGLSALLGESYPAVVVMLLSGLFGNWFYMKHVSGHVVSAAGMPDFEKQAYYQKFGGVSAANVWILLGITVGISMLWAIIAGLFFGFFTILY